MLPILFPSWLSSSFHLYSFFFPSTMSTSGKQCTVNIRFVSLLLFIPFLLPFRNSSHPLSLSFILYLLIYMNLATYLFFPPPSPVRLTCLLSPMFPSFPFPPLYLDSSPQTVRTRYRSCQYDSSLPSSQEYIYSHRRLRSSCYMGSRCFWPSGSAGGTMQIECRNFALF